MSVQETAAPTQAETTPIPAAGQPSRGGLVHVALGNVRQFGMLAALLLGLILFQFTTGGVMLKSASCPGSTAQTPPPSEVPAERTAPCGIPRIYIARCWRHRTRW